MSPLARRFAQVDVFGTTPAAGNPVAVVLDGDGLSGSTMQQLAAWLNVAETTFVLPSKYARADYRVRIFTVTEELPFAGHPTLGTCHAWIESGGQPKSKGVVVQECAGGLVSVRRDSHGLAFAAPPLIRSGSVDAQTRSVVLAALGVAEDHVLDVAWLDNGPGWLGVLLDSAEQVLDLTCSPIEQFIGVAGVHGDGVVEVRAFYPVRGAMVEDPVCGSLNAALADWLPSLGVVSLPYHARQGQALGRSGRLRLSADAEGIWVAGTTRTLIAGVLNLESGLESSDYS